MEDLKVQRKLLYGYHQRKSVISFLKELPAEKEKVATVSQEYNIKNDGTFLVILL